MGQLYLKGRTYKAGVTGFLEVDCSVQRTAIP
jgi:hypothetical protein